MSCLCERPQEYTNPKGHGSCGKCGRRLFTDKEMDGALAAFFDRLAEAQFPLGPDGLVEPDWWEHVRSHALVREMAGRERFGQRYLGRDNAIEAEEEAIDGILYSFLGLLRAKRTGTDEDEAVALTAAKHFALAHRYSRMLIAKRRGNTGPAWDED